MACHVKIGPPDQFWLPILVAKLVSNKELTTNLETYDKNIAANFGRNYLINKKHYVGVYWYQGNWRNYSYGIYSKGPNDISL